MSSILDSLQNHLGPDTIQQISNQIGSDPAATQNAIGMALPMLLSGLSSNAAQPEGAAALDTALGQHDGSILDNLGGLLGGAAGGGIGGAILGHILGSKRTPVEEGVARGSGLNTQQVGKLLILLAPIVMGVLGRMKQQGGMSADQLPDVLNRGKADLEARAPSTGGLGAMLDQNRDGSIADDVLRAGTSVLGGLFRK